MTDTLPTSSAETAACQKCGTEIAVDVDRCPQCGYEPSATGVIGSIIALVCLLWMGVGAILYLAAFGALLTGGYSVGNFILGLVLISAFTAIPAAYLYGLYKKSSIGPTEQVELFGQTIE